MKGLWCRRSRGARLGPAAGGVGHHGKVVALVAPILGQRDARVDAGLARGHRHVARVGHLQGNADSRPRTSSENSG